MNRKPALIAALVGVGVVLVMVVALILPKAGQVRAKQKDVQQAQQQQTVLQAQLDQLKAAAKDAPKDRKTLAQLKTQIPPTADLPGLIRSLNAVADKADVDFVSISPGQPTSAGSYSVVPVQLNVMPPAPTEATTDCGGFTRVASGVAAASSESGDSPFWASRALTL